MGDCYVHGALCPDSVAESIVDSYYDIYIHELVYIRNDGAACAYDDLNKVWRVTFRDPQHITNDEFKTELGHRLYKMIWYANTTQSELSEKIGMTQTMLSQYVTGKHLPSLSTAIKLADALGCPLQTLTFEFERQHG